MQANAFRLDGNAALALEVHGVEKLFLHFARSQRAGHFEQAVSERGFAVVDVRDDAEIPYELRVHEICLPLSSCDCFELFRNRQEPHASRIQDNKARKTMPCDSP